MPTQQTLMERVKQGDPDAIASLMNRTLHHHLNQVSAHVQIRRRGGEYRLLVEAPQLPDKQATVKWIVQGLTKLAIAQIQTVTVYGKSQQSAKPDWQYSFRLGSPAAVAAAPAEKLLDLSEHCFTRNRSLLSGNLTPPAKAVTRLTLSFAALPNAQKLVILPRLTQLLRRPEPVPGDEALEASAQAWIAEVFALDSNGLRQLSIWLSRYCAHPAETIKQLSPATVEELASRDDLSGPIPAGTALNPAVASVVAAQSARAEQLRSPETALFDQNSWLPVWILPTAWALCLAVAVTLGIQSANRTDFSFSLCEQAAPSAAQSTPQCTLAVQLVGNETSMADTIKAAVPLTPQTKAAAAENCSSYANTHVISALKIDGLAPPSENMTENAVDIASSQTTEIFPGVLLTEISQARNLPKIDSLSQISGLSQPGALSQTDSVEPKEMMRIACVGYSFATAENIPASAHDVSIAGDTRSPFKEIAADEIPAAWPEEPYDQATALNFSTEKALGVYDIFISFGANTLFTAIGVFVGVMLFSCYRCYTLTGVYQVALVLGVIETVVHIIPNVGLFLSLPLAVAAIGLASRFVKDFNIDWTEGYKSLARGAITIVAIRCVFLWLMYWAIAHFII